jgi:DNA ligase 1
MYVLPKRTHLVHKAIEPRKLSKTVAAAVADRKDDLWEIKYDGCNVILIKANGIAYAFSRQGEPVAGAMDRQVDAMNDCSRDNYVLFAEAWAPNLIHSEINGDFRRGHKPDDERRLKAIVFDVVSLSAFDNGLGVEIFENRTLDICDYTLALGDAFEASQQRDTKAECVAYVAERQDVHGEIFAIDGFMRKARKGVWVAGAGICGTNLKDKDLFTVDLKVDELVEGQGKYVGTLGAYICTYKGQRQRVGGGKLKDADRHAIWADQHRKEGGIGSIIEVNALGESTNGLLREPRFSRYRLDKTEGE